MMQMAWMGGDKVRKGFLRFKICNHFGIRSEVELAHQEENLKSKPDQMESKILLHIKKEDSLQDTSETKVGGCNS